MDALLAILIPALPELGIGSTLFAFAMWRERAHNTAATRWSEERAGLIAEKTAAVKIAREQFAEDDARRERRIAALMEENEGLELRLDAERAARRRLEDRTQAFPIVKPGGQR